MKRCESCNLVLSRNGRHCPACGTRIHQGQSNSVCFSVRLLGVTVLSFIRKNEVDDVVKVVSQKQEQKKDVVLQRQIPSNEHVQYFDDWLAGKRPWICVNRRFGYNNPKEGTFITGRLNPCSCGCVKVESRGGNKHYLVLSGVS